MKNSSDKKIFISYRVQDTAGETGRLVDALKQYFTDDQLFMDIENLEPGADFTEAIERSLSNCDVFLAVIGPRWVGPREGLPSRINEPDDWVRLEVATALQRNVRVVPLLVDGATLPKSDDLPPELQPLVRRQTMEISNKRWRYDTDQLVVFLVKGIGIEPKRRKNPSPLPPPPSSQKRKTILYVIGGFVLAVVVLGVIGTMMESEKTKQQATETTMVPETKQEPMNISSETEQPAVTSHADVSGTWYAQNEAENIKYLIQQSGSQLSVELYGNGVLMSRGAGTISGRQVVLDLNLMGIVMQATVSEDGRTMDGTNSSQSLGSSEAVKLARQHAGQ